MKQFRLNDRPFSLPTAWAELTAAQVLAVAPYLYAEPTSGPARLAVLRAVCPVPRKLLGKLTADQVWQLTEELTWIWRQELGACAVEQFTHRGRTYRLPEANLADVVAVEYAMATVYFRAFAHPQRPSAKALDQLVATLCRPVRADLNEADPHWDGQRRERYNGKLAEARAAELATLPVATKIVVLQLFLAGQRFIHRAYHELYRKGSAPAQRGAATAPSDGTELLELLADLAERGTYGTYEQAAYTSVHTIFFNLARQAKRRREAE